MKRYHILFKGRVQGVGFRYTAKTLAGKLDLTGTVKNLPHGDVEVYIQGDEGRIDQFVSEISNQGFIRVDSADKKEVDLKEDETSFEVIG